MVARVKSPFDVRYDVPLTLPWENPNASPDQRVPLSPDSTHFGSIENSDEVIVELVGIVNPSYVELEGVNPASSGENTGPCQVATSAAAQGANSIRNTRRKACLIGFTAGEPSVKWFETSFSLFAIFSEGLIGVPRHDENHGRADLPQSISGQRDRRTAILNTEAAGWTKCTNASTED